MKHGDLVIKRNNYRNTLFRNYSYLTLLLFYKKNKLLQLPPVIRCMDFRMKFPTKETFEKSPKKTVLILPKL